MINFRLGVVDPPNREADHSDDNPGPIRVIVHERRKLRPFEEDDE